MERPLPFFRKSDGGPRVGDWWVLSGIVHWSASHVNECPLVAVSKAPSNVVYWVKERRCGSMFGTKTASCSCAAP